MNVGFIGTGSMGSVLIESFIQSKALGHQEIIASNRTPSKVDLLVKQFKGLKSARSNIEVMLQSEIVFLCIKPSEFKAVVDEIKTVALPTQIVVSITSPVLISTLEQMLPCKIAKIIPSITNYVLSGATLCVYGERILPEDKLTLEGLLAYISTPIRISERFTRVSSDITSCGPAFLAFYLQKFIEGAVAETGIPYAEASRLAVEMLLGTGKLLTTGGMTPSEVQRRVAVPGGITEEGIHMMEKELDGVFNKLFRITHAKYEEDLAKVSSSFTL